MRVTLFGSGGLLTRTVLEALAPCFDVTSVVAPAARGAGGLGRLLRRAATTLGVRREPLSDLAKRVGAAHHRQRSRDDPALPGLVARSRPDVIVIATYPWILPPTVFGAARLGAVNLHPSLLPRHRGLLPLFWVYHADDRQSGVSAHWVTEEADAGPILRQASLDVPRGFSVDALYERKAALAGPLALGTLLAIERGEVTADAQDETRATTAPRVPSGRAMVDPDWPAERTWHFLAGLYPRFVEPLRSETGELLRYSSVLGYVHEPGGRPPGTTSRERDEIRLHCADGYVRLAAGAGAAP